MKLKILSTTVMALGIASAANAGWVVNPYIGATAGMGRETIYSGDISQTLTSRSYGAMLGLDLPIIRVEGEYNYLTTDGLEVNAAMLNAYVKIPSAIIKPYFGAGFGTVFGGNQNLDATKAYQGMVGATVDILKLPIKPEIEARVLYAPDIIDNYFAKPDLLNYELRLKLKYEF